MRKNKLFLIAMAMMFVWVLGFSACRREQPVEFHEVEVTPEILEKFDLPEPRTVENNVWLTWTNETAYYAAFQRDGERCEYWSLPYVEYRYSDVSSGNTTWEAIFKIAEYCQVGEQIYYGENVFEYNNVKLAFRCGDNAAFIRTYQGGKTLENKNSEEDLAGGWLANRLTTEAGETLDSRYVFKTCTDHEGETGKGDYFLYEGILSYVAPKGAIGTEEAMDTEGTAGTEGAMDTEGTADTEGALLIEFDMRSSFDSAVEHVEETILLPYSVRP